MQRINYFLIVSGALALMEQSIGAAGDNASVSDSVADIADVLNGMVLGDEVGQGASSGGGATKTRLINEKEARKLGLGGGIAGLSKQNVDYHDLDALKKSQQQMAGALRGQLKDNGKDRFKDSDDIDFEERLLNVFQGRIGEKEIRDVAKRHRNVEPAAGQDVKKDILTAFERQSKQYDHIASKQTKSSDSGVKPESKVESEDDSGLLLKLSELFGLNDVPKQQPTKGKNTALASGAAVAQDVAASGAGSASSAVVAAEQTQELVKTTKVAKPADSQSKIDQVAQGDVAKVVKSNEDLTAVNEAAKEEVKVANTDNQVEDTSEDEDDDDDYGFVYEGFDDSSMYISSKYLLYVGETYIGRVDVYEDDDGNFKFDDPEFISILLSMRHDYSQAEKIAVWKALAHWIHGVDDNGECSYIGGGCAFVGDLDSINISYSIKKKAMTLNLPSNILADAASASADELINVSKLRDNRALTYGIDANVLYRDNGLEIPYVPQNATSTVFTRLNNNTDKDRFNFNFLGYMMFGKYDFSTDFDKYVNLEATVKGLNVNLAYSTSDLDYSLTSIYSGLSLKIDNRGDKTYGSDILKVESDSNVKIIVNDDVIYAGFIDKGLFDLSKLKWPQGHYPYTVETIDIFGVKKTALFYRGISDSGDYSEDFKTSYSLKFTSDNVAINSGLKITKDIALTFGMSVSGYSVWSGDFGIINKYDNDKYGNMQSKFFYANGVGGQSGEYSVEFYANTPKVGVTQDFAYTRSIKDNSKNNIFYSLNWDSKGAASILKDFVANKTDYNLSIPISTSYRLVGPNRGNFALSLSFSNVDLKDISRPDFGIGLNFTGNASFGRSSFSVGVSNKFKYSGENGLTYDYDSPSVSWAYPLLVGDKSLGNINIAESNHVMAAEYSYFDRDINIKLAQSFDINKSERSSEIMLRSGGYFKCCPYRYGFGAKRRATELFIKIEDNITGYMREVGYVPIVYDKGGGNLSQSMNIVMYPGDKISVPLSGGSQYKVCLLPDNDHKFILPEDNCHNVDVGVNSIASTNFNPIPYVRAEGRLVAGDNSLPKDIEVYGLDDGSVVDYNPGDGTVRMSIPMDMTWLEIDTGSFVCHAPLRANWAYLASADDSTDYVDLGDIECNDPA